MASSASAATGNGTASAPQWQCFSYEEVARSHEFFVPLLWECAWQLQLVRGSAHHIVLFQPAGSEDDDDEDEEVEDASVAAAVAAASVSASRSAVGPIAVSAPSGLLASSASRGESGAGAQDELELLAAEMEQIYEEHALQRHIGDALTTPAAAAAIPLQVALPSTTPTPAHLTNSAHSLRGHD